MAVASTEKHEWGLAAASKSDRSDHDSQGLHPLGHNIRSVFIKSVTKGETPWVKDITTQAMP
jgi:hypothetical protein